MSSCHEPRLYFALTLDFERTALLEHEGLAQQPPRALRHLRASRHAVGFHAAGRIDRIAPDIEHELVQAGLKAQLARLERAPDERLIAAATTVAQDIGVAWEAASSERRKQLRESLFESVTVASGRVVAVRPRPEVAPLVAVKVHICGPDRIRTGDLVLDRDVC